MRQVKINVSLTDIKTGFPCNPTECPIARAVLRTTGLKIRVASDGYLLNNRKYSLPPEMEKFVDRYDSGQIVQPEEFTMEFPE